MKKPRYTLIEAAADLGVSVGDLIDFAADGQLTIHVIADHWTGKHADDPETEATVDGPVDLDPADVLKSLHADHVTVRQVQSSDGDRITLDPPQKIMRGVLYVTAEERQRLRAENESAEAAELRIIEEERLKDAPSYLDPNDAHYSEKLAAAVGAWIAIYADGGYQTGMAHKEQIIDWLRAHHPEFSNRAHEQIATIVNPNEKGGNPKTRKG